VLSRYAAHSTVHLLDPYGPRTIAEIRLEAPMRLFASVGAHALAVGALGAAVLTAGDNNLTLYQFPARSVPIAAGAAGGQFVVALAGAIEEWDPQSRMPKRRIKLAKAGVLTAVGGSDRVVWWTAQGDPTRLEVSPLVNRGQPKSHELPEPIAHASGHPRSDLVVCVGADSGRVYVVDLDGRHGLRVIGPEGIDRVEAAGLVVGRMVGVLAAQAKRPIAVVSLDRKEAEATTPIAVPVPRELEANTERADIEADLPKLSTLVEEAPPPAKPAPKVAAKSAPKAKPAPAAAAPAAAPVAASTSVSGAALTERFTAWRERLRQAQPPDAAAPIAWAEDHATWRDQVAGWARAVAAGTIDRDAPVAPPIDELMARFELASLLRPAVVLLYGAHLAGERGAAPIDVARVLGRHWDDALGRGQLAATGVALYADSRVRLAPAVQRTLDELPPHSGTLVGTPGSGSALLGPCVVVAAEGSLGLVAERCLPSLGGAILAAHANADLAELIFEARARGAVPLLEAEPGVLERVGERDPIVLVARDEAAAEALGVPRLS